MKPRLALITHEWPPDTGRGGIGTYTRQLATSMTERNYDVHVFAGSPYRSTTETQNGFTVYRVQCAGPEAFRTAVIPLFSRLHNESPFGLMECAEIHGNAWELKQHFPDIPLVVRIHAPNILVESLKKRYVPFSTKLRYVVGALRRFKWDLGYWRKYDKNQDSDFLFTKLADHITAPSQAMKNWAVSEWGIDPERIYKLPNFFTPPPAFLDIPLQENLMSKRILFFGRLNVLKGMVNVTKAMSKVLKAHPDWSFRVIGDDGAGPDSHRTMREWMKDVLHDVLDKVEFMDGLPNDQLPAQIADASIVVLPSLFESFSYTCAEAMAAGKAIVGSNSGGMTDLLEDGKCGMLVDPERSSEIKNAIEHLIAHPGIRSAMATAARKRVLESYNADLIGNDFDHFYRRIGKWTH